MRWLYSFLSRRPPQDATACTRRRRWRPSGSAAVRAGLPADVVTEVTGRVMPTGILAPAGSTCTITRARAPAAYIAACVRFTAPIFVRMLRTWFAAVCSLITSCAGDVAGCSGPRR